MTKSKLEFKEIRLTTPEFIISYPKLGERYHDEFSGKMQYSCEALIEKGSKVHEEWKEFMKKIEGLGEEWFGKKKHKIAFTFKDLDEVTDREGDILSDKYPEMKNKLQLSLHNARAITMPVCDLDKHEIDATDTSVMYGGCVCRARLQIHNYDFQGYGVTKKLLAVQKLRDGEKLGGKKQEDPSVYIDEF